jgi:hypothetical protein
MLECLVAQQQQQQQQDLPTYRVYHGAIDRWWHLL